MRKNYWNIIKIELLMSPNFMISKPCLRYHKN